MAKKKCELCKKEVSSTWPRIVGKKRKMLCDDCKDFYPKPHEV